jgi:hypothetical protein
LSRPRYSLQEASRLPFNAHGFWPLQFKSSGAVMAQHSATDGVVFWDAVELSDAQGKATPRSTAPLKPDSTTFFYLMPETPDSIAICCV